MDAELEPAEPICRLLSFYSVVIDYGQNFEEMIGACGFNDIHPDIIPPISWLTEENRKEKAVIQMIQFPKAIEFHEARPALRQRNLRPINIFELLSLAKDYPEIQWTYPVMALGSKWRNRTGDQGVAYLWHNPSGRALLISLIQPGKKWQSVCRFGAISLSC